MATNTTKNTPATDKAADDQGLNPGFDNGATDAAESDKKPGRTALIDEIGTLTYPRAVAAFGKDRAIGVMHKVAAIGGHGMFEEDHFKSPLFGGLAMPSPDSVVKPRKEAFAHLPEADFYFQSALEDYEVTREQAAAARTEINEYFNSLK